MSPSLRNEEDSSDPGPSGHFVHTCGRCRIFALRWSMADIRRRIGNDRRAGIISYKYVTWRAQLDIQKAI